MDKNATRDLSMRRRHRDYQRQRPVGSLIIVRVNGWIWGIRITNWPGCRVSTCVYTIMIETIYGTGNLGLTSQEIKRYAGAWNIKIDFIFRRLDSSSPPLTYTMIWVSVLAVRWLSIHSHRSLIFSWFFVFLDSNCGSFDHLVPTFVLMDSLRQLSAHLVRRFATYFKSLAHIPERSLIQAQRAQILASKSGCSRLFGK